MTSITGSTYYLGVGEANYDAKSVKKSVKLKLKLLFG